PNGTHAPLEIALLAKVSAGFHGVIQLLEWAELPKCFLLVLERPEWRQDLFDSIVARGWSSQPDKNRHGGSRQGAQTPCTGRFGVQARKGLDCSAALVCLGLLMFFGAMQAGRRVVFPHPWVGTPSYSPPEWSHLKRYHNEAATIWSLGILLYLMVCRKHPFKKGQDIIWGQLLLPQRLSPECQGLMRRCLSMHCLDRPSLEDLFYDPWLQGVHLP
ncbi:PIM1 kinase, partial [Edolisoma coerulescens]|nr:PIM1 kinase [Edolisoma coerulescens]